MSTEGRTFVIPTAPSATSGSSWPPGLLSDSSPTAKAQVGLVAAYQPPEAALDFRSAKPLTNIVTLTNQPGPAFFLAVIGHFHTYTLYLVYITAIVVECC